MSWCIVQTVGIFSGSKQPCQAFDFTITCAGIVKDTLACRRTSFLHSRAQQPILHCCRLQQRAWMCFRGGLKPRETTSCWKLSVRLQLCISAGRKGKI